jgi:hypothetical protein
VKRTARRLHIARKAIPRRKTDAGVIRIEIIHPHGGKDFSLEQLGRAGRHQPKQPIGGVAPSMGIVMVQTASRCLITTLA